MAYAETYRIQWGWRMGFSGSSDGSLSAMQETQFRSLGWDDLLEKGMIIRPSVLAWRISWTEDAGRPQFMGWQRSRQDWATNNFLKIGWGKDKEICNSWTGFPCFWLDIPMPNTSLLSNTYRLHNLCCRVHYVSTAVPKVASIHIQRF